MSNGDVRNSSFSFPLYGAAFAATLCGVLTVTDTVEDSTFAHEAISLTCAGFAFSLGCRALRISSRFVEWLCLGIIVFVSVGSLTNRVDWGALIPPTVGKNDTRMAVMLCWATVLLSWTLLQDSTTLFTPLLAVAAIGVVASFDLNDYVVVDFVVLLVATIFMLTHYQSLRLRELAVSGEDILVSANPVTAQLALAAACGLAVIALGLLLIAPVEAVSHNLSLAGAIRRLANIAPGPTSGSNAFRFTDDSHFPIGTGMGWSASTNVLARVTPSDGQPHLWRGRTYDHYDGSGWQSTTSDQWKSPTSILMGSDGSLVYALPTVSFPGRAVLSASFEIVGDTDEFYYASVPRRLILAQDPGVVPRFCDDGRLDLSDDRPLSQMRYAETSLLPPDPMDPAVQVELRHAPMTYPLSIQRRYLGNMSDPENGQMNPQAMAYFRRAVVASLQDLPRSRRRPIDEALAIRDWVSNHCVYSLNVQAIPEDQDHVYAFLAQTRRGYCDLFASSMAVLCRVAGIPARVATGFAPGQLVGSAYNLRALDRHAWTEVYFPGAGWLAFDPTMGTRTDGSIPNPKASSSWTWAGLLHRLGPGPVILAATIVLILLYVAGNEWFQRRRLAHRHPVGRARPARDDAGRRYAQLAQALAGAGVPRNPAETPIEYAARVERFLEEQAPGGPQASVVRAFTEDWNQSRYGNQPQSSDPAADQALREFVHATQRLRWRLLWQRFGQLIQNKHPMEEN